MYSIFNSPIGKIALKIENELLTELFFIKDDENEVISKNIQEKETDIIIKCKNELTEYFIGERKKFDIPLNIHGTEFRKKVWYALTEIPYGETASYKDIATKVGNPKAVRAVGGANHNNLISIIIPCHRVIGADGNLTGYGGELWRKEWLLNMEKSNK